MHSPWGSTDSTVMGMGILSISYNIDKDIFNETLISSSKGNNNYL